MTRAKVFQLALFVLVLGPIGYLIFRYVGLDSISAGIAAEAILIMIVFFWTGSYLFRVVNGKMTFVEQRKRYREAYEKLTNAKLQEKFDSMPEEEKVRIMNEIANEEGTIN